MTTKDTTIHCPADPNIEALFTWAEEHFGYSEKQVRLIMKHYNIDHYNKTMWWTCAGLIRYYHEDEISYRLYPDKCPICDAEIQRDTSRDNLFGVRHGWSCTADRFHFMKHRVNEMLRRARENHDGRTEK